MLPCGTDKQTTSEDRATQLLICEALSFAIALAEKLGASFKGWGLGGVLEFWMLKKYFFCRASLICSSFGPHSESDGKQTWITHHNFNRALLQSSEKKCHDLRTDNPWQTRRQKFKGKLQSPVDIVFCSLLCFDILILRDSAPHRSKAE